MIDWLRRLLTRQVFVMDTAMARRIRLEDEPPPETFVIVIFLMIVFFAGLILLQIVHMALFETWNDAVWNGIMLIVGTIVGALWGYREA